MSKPPIRGINRTQRFGNKDTAKKQSVVVSYLAAYLRVMSKQAFHLSYVDAFAGCGARIDAAEVEAPQTTLPLYTPAPQPKVGTALEALRLKPGFHRYVFGDLNRRHLNALEARISEARSAGEALPETFFFRVDANELVRQECEWLKGHKERRAVMFLDPYGMQVQWQALQTIANCPQIDLWLLLPTGIAINRLLPWKREQHPRLAERLDAFYGSGDWRSVFLSVERDLLGMERQARASNLDGIVRFTMDRLMTLFGGGLYPAALPLRAGRHQSHQSYHLVFANSSKDERIWKIAHNIAGHLMRKAQAGN
jgi:three-Cys-motif partner protein